MVADRPGARMKGPLARQAILNGIARGRFGPDSRINALGGEAKPIADHPDFRGCFIPGSADEVTILGLREDWQRSMRRTRWRRIASYCLSGSLLISAFAALWYSSQTRMFVLPVEVSEKIENEFHQLVDAVDRPDKYLEVVSADSIPHGAWVEAQRREEDGGAAFTRARAAFWGASGRDLNEVRRLFLVAIGAAPLDPEPLAGLIIVNSLMLDTRPALLGEVSRALSRMDTLAAIGPGPDAARAALALSRGSRLEATRLSEKCAAIDPLCGMLHGLATLNPTAVRDSAGELADTRLALGFLAEAALVAEEWATVEGAIEAIFKNNRNDLRGWELKAEAAAALGKWDSALSAANKAIVLGSERAEIFHLSVAIRLDKGEHPTSLVPAFRELVAHPYLAGQTSREVALVQAAWVHVQAGNLSEARTVIDGALEAHPASVSARVLLADILYKDGDHAASEGVLQGVEVDDLEAAQAARVHLWAGRIYLDMGRVRLARAELEEAKRLSPRSPAVVEEMVWASLKSGNTAEAIASVREMVPLAPFRGLVIDPREGSGLRAPTPRRLSGPLLNAIDQDVRFGGERDSIEAILAWWNGDRDGFELLRQARDARSGDLEVQIALALAAFENEDWKTALEASTVVVGRKPSLAIMHSIRGRALARLGRWAEALDPIGRSIKGEAEQPSLLMWAAEEHARNGDAEAADGLLSSAEKLAPWDPRIRQRRFALKQQSK